MGTDQAPSDAADTAMGVSAGALLGAVARAPDIPLEWMGPPSLQPGDVVGDCFEVERILGRGGMGVVHLARDRELDRPVALKLHRRGSSAEALPRMLAEAKAMARIVHANVVSVYMVGTHRGALFIAMEYCPGGTLRDWLREQDRSVDRVLDMFAAVGEGLAAAHRAGVVHRDFKPDNVFLAEDGQPRVADFGLALDVAAEGLVDPATGGTPAYMPPEQFGEDTVDARTDQFAFCVALYEGLAGVRPFDPTDEHIAQASSAEARRERWETTVEAGPARLARGVPSQLMRVLQRGLHADPADRFADMDALLRALRRARHRRFRTLALIGAMAAGGAGVWVVGAWAEPGVEGCDPSTRLNGIWDAQRRGLLSERASGAPSYERDAWSSMSASLDDYADRWRLMWAQVCADHGPTNTEHPARQCLSHARGRMLALVETLPESASSRAALGSLAELPDPLACANAQPSTRSPDADALAERLEQVLVRVRADPSHAVIAPLEGIVRRAGVEGWQDVRSAAERHLGRATFDASGIDDAEPHYRAAILHGLASGRPALSIRAWNDFAVLLAGVGRAQDAAELSDLAWAAVTSHEDPRLRFHVAMGRISVLRDEGRQDEAIEVGEVALAEQITRLGSNHLLVANARINLGAALHERGRIREALEHYRAALETERAAYGPAHPHLASVLGNIGWACTRMAEFDCARSSIERALAIRVAAYGADDPRTTDARSKWAVLLQRTGAAEDALAVFHEILALERARSNPTAAPLRARWPTSRPRVRGWSTGMTPNVMPRRPSSSSSACTASNIPRSST